MEEPPRAQSAMATGRSSVFHVRTSKFVQKISAFRNKVTAPKSKPRGRDVDGPYMRRTNAQAKPFMSQPMLGVHLQDPDADDSSQSASSGSPSPQAIGQPGPPRLARHSISAGVVVKFGRGDGPGAGGTLLAATRSISTGTRTPAIVLSQPASPPPPPLPSDGRATEPTTASHPLRPARQSISSAVVQQSGGRPVDIDGLPPVDMTPKAKFRTPGTPVAEIALSGSNAISSSSLDTTAKVQHRAPVDVPTSASSTASNSSVDMTPKARYRLPSTPVPKTATTTTAVSQVPQAQTPVQFSHNLIPGTSSPPSAFLQPAGSTLPSRRAPPRLSGLPPSLHRFSLSTSDGGLGTARLSPSIISRHPPMPILNLPTLPVIPPTPSTEQQSHARLRSMPALPHQGPNPLDAPSADQHEDIDDDMDEADDDDADMDTPLGSEDEDDEERMPRSSTSSDASFIASPLRPRSRSPLRLGNAAPLLPHVETSRFDSSFIDQLPENAKGKGRAQEWNFERRVADRTPTASRTNSQDYFSTVTEAKDMPTPSPTRTPRPRDVIPNFAAQNEPLLDPVKKSSQARPMTAQAGPSRPAIYSHASKSMVDLLSTAKREKLAEEEAAAQDRKMIGRAVAGTAEATTENGNATAERQRKLSAAPAYDGPTHNLMRRRSMPTFNPATLPPPYPAFARHPYAHPMDKSIVIVPRDDEIEGKERLPPYKNDLYLKAVMPRKMELTQPGQQAPDRKWRRVMCVLEGTVFRVYHCPASVAGVGVLGEWWERKVGVGDNSAPSVTPAISGRIGRMREPERVRTKDELNSPYSPTSPVAEETGSSQPPSPSVVSPPTTTPSSRSQFEPHHNNRSRLNIAVNLLKPRITSRSHSRTRSDGLQPSRTSSSPRTSLNLPRPSFSSSRTTSDNARVRSPPAASSSSNMSITESPSSASSSRSHFIGRTSPSGPPELPDPDPADLIQAYTMQNAESGLGNDYRKRRNVIRVRMEGQQFLLQAPDVAATVEWIEGFQAATNIALDLDERAMPRGPLFPRRRRRRNLRRVEPEGSATPEATTTTT